MTTYSVIAPFIPVTIENSTCDISSATIGTLFSCVVCVSWTKIQGRYCCLCFVVFTQCDVCQSCTFQHKHNIRREKRKKNDKIDESSKIERMLISLSFFHILEFFLPNLKGIWYNSLSFWQSFLIFSWKTLRKQVPIVGKLQVCHFLQQIITSRLKFYTTMFWIGPHNFEFLEKKSLSFWPKAKTLSYFGLEFFQKCTKNKPGLNMIC